MIKILFMIIPILIIIVVAIAIITSSSNNKKTDSTIDFKSYKKVTSILTDAELNFFNVLRLALQNSEFIICPKIRIADFVKVTNKENWQKNFNKINSKHIDFLICNDKLNPILAIELDDKSHNNNKDRDNFVNELYKSINLPVLRITNVQAYSVIKLREKIKEII